MTANHPRPNAILTPDCDWKCIAKKTHFFVVRRGASPSTGGVDRPSYVGSARMASILLKSSILIAFDDSIIATDLSQPVPSHNRWGLGKGKERPPCDPGSTLQTLLLLVCAIYK